MIQDLTHELALPWQGVLSALQGVKAENSFVIAVFLKILLLGSSGSIVAAKLIQSGTVFMFCRTPYIAITASTCPFDMLRLTWRPHHIQLASLTRLFCLDTYPTVPSCLSTDCTHVLVDVFPWHICSPLHITAADVTHLLCGPLGYMIASLRQYSTAKPLTGASQMHVVALQPLIHCVLFDYGHRFCWIQVMDTP